MINKYSLFTLLFLFVGFFTFSQDFNSKWFTSNQNDLPQNTVESVVKDKFNFIWISTQNGLVRYDGANFKWYISGFRNVENRISMIQGDLKKDSLYAFFPDKKIGVLINKRKPVFFKKGKNYDKNNRFFKKAILNSILSNRFDWKYSYDIECKFDFEDKSYFKLFKGNVTYFDFNNKPKFNHFFEKYLVNNFFSSDNKFYFLKNSQELYRFNRDGTVNIFPTGFKKNDKVSLIVNWVNQQVFVIIEDKIYMLKFHNGQPFFRLLFKSSIVSENIIFSLLYDQNSNKLFIGTDSSGLCEISFNSLKVFKKDINKVESHNAITKFNDSLIVSSSGSIFTSDGFNSSFRTTRYNEYGIIQFNQNILLQHNSEILIYDTKQNFKERVFFNIGKNRFLKTISLGRNRLWFTTKHNSDNPIDDKMRFGYVTLKNGRPFGSKFFFMTNHVNVIHEIDSSNVMLGAEEGLFIFNLNTGMLKRVISNCNVRTIYLTGKEFYWITTYGDGLYLLYKGKKYKLPTDNKSLLTPHCVLEDNKGYYWTSTNNGLYQFSKKNLLRFINDPSTPVYFHGYTKRDGLLNNEFNGGGEKNAIGFDKGEFFFTSMDGIVCVNTSAVNPILADQSLYIDRVKIDEKEMSVFNDTLKLRKAYKNLILYIDSPNNGNEINQSIQYSLGSDSFWISLPESKTITLTNAETGYTNISLRIFNNFDGKYTTKKFTIFIEPHFWEELWFVLFIFLCFIFFVVLIIKYRLRHISNENQKLSSKIEERTKDLNLTISQLNLIRQDLIYQTNNQKKLIRSITHDIKSPLQFLTSTSQYLHSISREGIYLEASKSIYESSFQLFNHIDNLLNYSKILMFREEGVISKCNLHTLFNEKIALFQNIANLEGNSIINSLKKEIFVETNIIFLNIIIHNLIDNALKNTKKGQVTLDAFISENYVTIVISDNGRGMSKCKIKKIFSASEYDDTEKTVGYTIVNELIKLIKGKIIIESELEKGTQVYIFLLKSL